MATKIYKIIKKIIFCFFIIYGFNFLVKPLEINIPLNIYTIGSMTILGLPAFVALLTIYFIMY